MIVVIGKSGQLATELSQLNVEGALVCLGRNEIDLTQSDSVAATLDTFTELTAVINASAYTAVDKAESEPEQADRLNHHAVKRLAQYCVARSVHFVHVSTDYVFNGEQGKPYAVQQARDPQGAYGISKARGEAAIEGLESPLTCIIRTSWVYSAHGNNFVKTMLRLMSEKPALSVVGDQIGSPTSAHALAKICLYAAQERVSGIHHFTDAGVASWFDFAYQIQQIGCSLGLLKTKIPLSSITSQQYPTPAKRPHYSVLDKSSLATAFPTIQLRHWCEELTDVLQQLTNQHDSK